MADKHKLPVIQDTPEDLVPDRAPYQWVGFGAVAIFIAWLPLAALMQRLATRVAAYWLGTVSSAEEVSAALARLGPEARVAVALAQAGFPALGLVLASLAGGFLVGRWGGAAGVREAALSGAAAVAVVAVLTFQGGVSWTPIVAVVLASGAAALGGAWGRKRRPKR